MIVQGDRILYANNALARLYGYTLDEFHRLATVDNTLAPEERARIARYRHNRAHDPTLPTTYELRGQRKDGTNFWVENVIQIVDWDGTPAIKSAIRNITERKAVETALQESERRYRELVEGSIEGILVRSGNKAVFANQRFAEIFGYTVEEILALDGTILLVHPDDREFIQTHFRARIARQDKPQRYEFRGLRKDGSIVWIRNSAHLIDWQGSSAVQVIVIDISEQKRTEEALRASESRFRDLVEGSIQGIAVLRPPELKPLFVNEGAARIFGFASAQELLDQPSVMPCVAPADRVKLRDYMIARLNGEPVPEVYEFEGIRTDGRPVWVENMVRIVEWQGQKCLQGTLIDVTERKRAEASAQGARDFLQTVIDAIPAAVGVKDRRRRYVIANRYLAAAHGLSPAEMLGQPTGIRGSAGRRLKADDDYVFQSGKPLPLQETEIPLGDARYWLQTKVPITDDSGQIEHILTVSFDITARRKAEDDLKASEERYRNLIENAPEAIIIHVDKSIQYANAAAAKMLGAASPQGLIGWSVLDLVDPRMRREILTRMSNALRGRVPPLLEQTLRRLDGQMIHVEAMGHRLEWEGRPAVQLTARDIGERKRTEEALRLTQFALDKAAGAVVWNDASGRYVYVNAAACRLFGYSREEFLRLSIPDINPAIQRLGWALTFEEIKAAPRGRRVAVRNLLRKDGTTIIAEATSNYIRFGDKDYLFAFIADITKRKRAEDALRLSQFALDKAAFTVLWTDMEGRYVYVNEAATKMLGYKREEFAESLSIFDITPELTKPMWQRAYKRLKSGRARRVSSPRQLRRKDGSLVTVEISANYLNYGGHEYVFSVCTDISERKRAEDALRLTQFALDNTGDAFFWIDSEGHFISVNRAAIRLLGYSGKQFQKMMIPDIDDGFTIEQWRDFFRRVRRSGSQRGEYVVKRRDGSTLPVEIADNYIKFGDREYVFASMRDISQRKAAEDVLREREQQFKNLAENIPGTVFQRRIDANGKISFPYVSRGSIDVWGVEAERVMRDPNIWLGALNPEDRVHFERELKRSAQRLTPLDMELRAYGSDGERRWVRLRSRPRRTADGSTIWEGVSLDTTEQKRAEQRLREHESRLAHILRVSTISEMATALAHQLGQPLNAIANYTRGSVRRMKSGQWSMEEVTAAMERASTQAERAANIVRRIAEFIRTSEPLRVPASINNVVTTAATLAEGEANEAGVKLALKLVSDLPPVAFDEIQIEQVLLNLIRNGIDAMTETWSGRRELTVRTAMSEDGKAIQVDVHDTGPPVDAATVDGMFEPFQSSKSKGMGMGLAISRTLVEAHEGRLWATSNKDRGMTFHFTLPIAS